MKKNKIIIVLLCVLVLSNVSTYFLARGSNDSEPSEDAVFEEDEETEQEDLEELALFFEVLDVIKTKYIEDVDMEELIEGAVKGMIEALGDPQTTFISIGSMDEMMEKTMGSFGGIGIHIQSVDGIITIISPIKGTPGERAGLLPGDQIIEVDGDNVEDMDINKAVSMMRGPVGEEVTIKIRREGVSELLPYSIIRDNIDVETVFPEMLEDNIGYIQISNFDSSTGREFNEALSMLEEENMEGLILDLRDNPGGLLTEAIKVAQAIVPAGPITHVVDGFGNIIKTHFSQGEEKPYPIAVLVNNFSASASEIVAGALQDSHGAVLVGSQTFGKATVQNLKDLRNNSGIRYTIARYLTPNKRNIDGEGLKPDYEVELPEIFKASYHPLTGEPSPGDSGDAVVFVKKVLDALGYDTEPGNYFGAETEKALRHFQREQGITQTGYLDEKTKSHLIKELGDVLMNSDSQFEKAMSIIKEKVIQVTGR